MSRLTRKNETIDKPYLEMCDLEMSFRNPSMYSTNCYTGKAVDKLSKLEDVLEEFGVDSAEELREQFSKAIVPEFETYQPIFFITQYYTSTKGVPEYDIIKDKYYVAENENEIILGWNYAQNFNQRKYYYVRKDWVFSTQAEAQAKLDELLEQIDNQIKELGGEKNE